MLTDNWTRGAASRHTTAKISHTRPSAHGPRQVSYYSFPDVITHGAQIYTSILYSCLDQTTWTIDLHCCWNATLQQLTLTITWFWTHPTGIPLFSWGSPHLVTAVSERLTNVLTYLLTCYSDRWQPRDRDLWPFSYKSKFSVLSGSYIIKSEDAKIIHWHSRCFFVPELLN